MKSNEMYFEKLKDLKIKSIGVLGTREEVVDTLHGFGAISKSIFNALKSDDSNSGSLSPGIHAILPVNLQQPGFNWDGVLFVFYWPMTTSFDRKRTMKATKYMKKVCSSSAWSHLLLNHAACQSKKTMNSIPW